MFHDILAFQCICFMTYLHFNAFERFGLLEILSKSLGSLILEHAVPVGDWRSKRPLHVQGFLVTSLVAMFLCCPRYYVWWVPQLHQISSTGRSWFGELLMSSDRMQMAQFCTFSCTICIAFVLTTRLCSWILISFRTKWRWPGEPLNWYFLEWLLHCQIAKAFWYICSTICHLIMWRRTLCRAALLWNLALKRSPPLMDTLSGSKLFWVVVTLSYTILHYNALDYTTLYHATVHNTTVHYNTLQYATLITPHHNYSCNCNYTTVITLHYSYNLQLQLHYTTTTPTATTTTALHQTTSSSCGEVTTATIATTPENTTPTTFRTISGFALPTVSDNNQPFL